MNRAALEAVAEARRQGRIALAFLEARHEIAEVPEQDRPAALAALADFARRHARAAASYALRALSL